MCRLHRAHSIDLRLCYTVKSADVLHKRLVVNLLRSVIKLPVGLVYVKHKVWGAQLCPKLAIQTLVVRVLGDQCESSDGNSYNAALVSKEYQNCELECS